MSIEQSAENKQQIPEIERERVARDIIRTLENALKHNREFRHAVGEKYMQYGLDGRAAPPLGRLGTIEWQDSRYVWQYLAIGTLHQEPTATRQAYNTERRSLTRVKKQTGEQTYLSIAIEVNSNHDTPYTTTLGISGAPTNSVLAVKKMRSMVGQINPPTLRILPFLHAA